MYRLSLSPSLQLRQACRCLFCPGRGPADTRQPRRLYRQSILTEGSGSTQGTASVQGRRGDSRYSPEAQGYSPEDPPEPKALQVCRGDQVSSADSSPAPGTGAPAARPHGVSGVHGWWEDRVGGPARAAARPARAG